MFPSEVPTILILEFVSMLRSGSFKSDPIKAIKLALWISGSTLETFFPSINDLSFAMNADATPDEQVEQLSAAIVAEFPDESEASATSISEVSPNTLAMIAKLGSIWVAGNK